MSETTTTVPVPVDATIQNPALVRLVDIASNINVQDMNYIFHYSRVKKPDNNDSNLFALHYKEQQQENWSSCKSLLTEQFTVARTDLIVQQIQQNLGGDIQGQRHYRSDTSVKTSFTLSGFQIDVSDEAACDLILFKLITNIDADVQVLSSSKLTFNIINGFSGNHALQLTFGILKNMSTRLNNEDKSAPINNVFILDRFTKRLIHDNRLSISIEDVTNVQRSLSQQITDFKSIPFTVQLKDDVISQIPKKVAKRFEALYDQIPENIRNFYYVSYVLSSILDEEKKIALEIKLRAFINEKITQAITARDNRSS